MTVISLIDIYPPARDDGESFITLRLWEGASQGAWPSTGTIIEEFVREPVADPANPEPWDVTSENATLDAGWYWVDFLDQTGDPSLPSEPIHNVVGGAWIPTVRDVASLLRTRTKTDQGELGRFTAATRPSSDQVYEKIRIAESDVYSAIGTDAPITLQRNVRDVISLGAALLVELSYFPEQVNSNRSPYSQYKVLYDERLARLIAAMSDAGEESAEAQYPSYGGFPTTMITMEEPW